MPRRKVEIRSQEEAPASPTVTEPTQPTNTAPETPKADEPFDITQAQFLIFAGSTRIEAAARSAETVSTAISSLPLRKQQKAVVFKRVNIKVETKVTLDV